jgi:hypothetical protein
MLRSALRTALAAALLPALALADELALSVERVVVFKDGTALVVKRASGVPDAFGRVHTDDVPDAAALGCFWAAVDPAGASAGLRIGAMRAERVEEALPAGDPVAVRSMLELLRANAGRDVRLRLRAADGPEVSGTLAEVLPDAGLVVLKRAGGGAEGPSATALPIADVHAVLGDDLATRRDADPAVASKKRLTLELARGDGPAPGGEGAEPVELRLFYFTPGLRWIPTYRLSGDLLSGGRLALQAELLNELEDLQGAELDLVVGVPNFRFGKTISPLALEGTMRNALLQAAPDLMGGGSALSNALFTQRAGEFRAFDPQPEAEAGGEVIAPELGATGEQDLYVYHAGKLDLLRGARATLPLWEHDVALDHLYTYDLAVKRGTPYAYGVEDRGPGASPLALSDNAVWHQLRLANATPHPWTTGPLLLLQGLLPLGQELLTYTPAGGDALVPITVAVDVRGGYSEEELGREERALNHNGHQYTRLTKRLTLKVKNFREQAAHVRVAVGLGGRVTSTSEGGTVVHGEPRSSDWEERNLFDHVLNPHADVSFEADLAPGEERTFTLEVELYAS